MKLASHLRLTPLACALAASLASAQTLPPPPASPTPVAKFEYDAEGRPTKSVIAPDTRNYATQSGYDALGRRTSSTDAKNGLTQFGYDQKDQLTSVTDPRQLVTQYQPTGLGDIKVLASPDTGTANSTFDAAGNLTTRTDARGVLATYTYDEIDRPTKVAYTRSGDASRTVNLTYDQTGASFGYGKGRLTTAATPDASTTFRYDAFGQVTTTVQSGAAGNPLVVNTDYDTSGRVTGLTYPSGRSVTFGWANGQPASITITSGGITTTLLDQVVMSPLGPAQSWVWKFGSTARSHERFYDANGRLVRHPMGVLVRDITYDDADRITNYTHYAAATAQAAPAYDQSFSYDELGRLTAGTASNTSWGYAYDANGNRTMSSAGASTPAQMTIELSSNRVTSVFVRSGRQTTFSSSYAYDASGNTLSYRPSSVFGGYTAAYSLEGRLASMMQGDTVGVEFGYDAMGRRVTRGQWMGTASNPRVYTLYAYDLANHLIGEYQADGTVITEYVWFGDTPVAVIKPDAAAPGGIQIYAIHTDHLDTPRVILDAQGNVRWRWMGEPFGASAAEEQPTAGLAALQQNLRFPGQQYEAFGGRHYNHFRDYDPTTGRYVQSDPIGLSGGINTYGYVYGDPLSNVDPDGQFANMVIGGASSIAMGWIIAKMTGNCYDWKDALFDGATGAAGVGIASKLRSLYRIRELRRIAQEKNMIKVGAQKNVEKWRNAVESTEMEIKPPNFLNPNGGINHPGSWPPRARLKISPGNPNGVPKMYEDPFSGKIGPKRSDAAHIPLVLTLPESAGLGGLIGGANNAERDCSCER